MAAKATFSGLRSYNLTGVRVTKRELGRGSYATVLEMEYVGLKCAGKKIHDVLLDQGDTSYNVRRFEEECRLLSQVRHPNIVQFLGVHFNQGVRAPILVMEFLPTNLTSCIENSKSMILPKEMIYSILQDVALGLYYLHDQSPPIIHRDLSSNNVLLTSNMTAKISDLGVARILDLTPLQVSRMRMTQTPGTPAYMPPEVMIANPIYDASVDEFSYGVLMIHIFSGEWPEPQVGPSKIESGKLIPVTEAERREVFLHMIGNDHPLMQLILRCINNDPKLRAHADEITRKLAEMTEKFPTSFGSWLEMLRRIEADEKEKENLKEEGKRKSEEIQQKEEQISSLREKIKTMETEYKEEIDRLSVVHSTELEQLQLQVGDLTIEKESLESINKAASVEKNALETKIECFSSLFTQQERMASDAVESFENSLLKEKNEHQHKLEEQQQRFEILLTEERRIKQDIIKEKTELQAQAARMKSEIDSAKIVISKMETEIATSDATVKSKVSEIQARTNALQAKDATILGMSEQLTRARKYMVNNHQSLQATITWMKCADVPTDILSGQSTVINSKVYVVNAGIDSTKPGASPIDQAQDLIHCYDTLLDEWTTLPALPIILFGLGQVKGKLVAIGGEKKSGVDPSTNEIFTFDERSRKWKKTIPPMPTARHSPAVLSLDSTLVVAGGDLDGCDHYTAVVEIFKSNASQWYRTDPLPTACEKLSLVSVGSSCYALGGYSVTVYEDSDSARPRKDPLYYRQPLPQRRLKQHSICYNIQVDALLHNATPANQSETNDDGDSQSAWKTVPDTPVHGLSIALLADSLLFIGEVKTRRRTAETRVYLFVPSTNSWMYISDLSIPCSSVTAVALSPLEILVIGGWKRGRFADTQRQYTVFKGTLSITGGN